MRACVSIVLLIWSFQSFAGWKCRFDGILGATLKPMSSEKSKISGDIKAFFSADKFNLKRRHLKYFEVKANFLGEDFAGQAAFYKVSKNRVKIWVFFRDHDVVAELSARRKGREWPATLKITMSEVLESTFEGGTCEMLPTKKVKTL